MSLIFSLFLTFAKIGLFTFGGGYAMISLIENICVDKKHWITYDEMMNLTVIAESTPGSIAINFATYVGHKQKGLTGAIAATIGVTVPSFLIIFLISAFFDSFLEIAWIARAFWGVKIAVGILIADAGLKMIKKMNKKPLSLFVVSCAFMIAMAINIFSLRLSYILVILIAAVISLMVFCIKQNADKGAKEK